MRDVFIIWVCTLVLAAGGVFAKTAGFSITDSIGYQNIFAATPGLGSFLSRYTAASLSSTRIKANNDLCSLNAIMKYSEQWFDIQQHKLIGDCSTGGPSGVCL